MDNSQSIYDNSYTHTKYRTTSTHKNTFLNRLIAAFQSRRADTENANNTSFIKINRKTISTFNENINGKQFSTTRSATQSTIANPISTTCESSIETTELRSTTDTDKSIMSK
ncbi:hypothetical protein FF38_09262 [Lucilia cuprina]|uniref:Uncharacterized protein n=1 Tax=Lucilia cuprina TaxID=7375 RepID=A0A0L0C3V3_LUCCU|nr:hypothetical protein FF38_09262 [Lucilia cuprina]